MSTMTTSYMDTDREIWRTAESDVTPIGSHLSIDVDKLEGWSRTINAINSMNRRARLDDEIEWPSDVVMEKSRRIAELLRQHGQVPPMRVVPDGIGGLSFEWRLPGGTSEYLNVYEEGTVDVVTYENSKEVSRRSAP